MSGVEYSVGVRELTQHRTLGSVMDIKKLNKTSVFTIRLLSSIERTTQHLFSFIPETRDFGSVYVMMSRQFELQRV